MLWQVTIIARSKGALGFAQYLPKDIQLRSKDQIMDLVCMALAGAYIHIHNLVHASSSMCICVCLYVYVYMYRSCERGGDLRASDDRRI